MKEYGYIEDGYLRSRFVEDDEIAKLDKVWKPVDAIDDSLLTQGDDMVVIPVPYDAGDHIAYNYITKKDTGGIKQEINRLKQALTDTDYKVLKCYEASLTGNAMPYDIGMVHSERQSLRDKINELETKIS